MDNKCCPSLPLPKNTRLRRHKGFSLPQYIILFIIGFVGTGVIIAILGTCGLRAIYKHAAKEEKRTREFRNDPIASIVDSIIQCHPNLEHVSVSKDNNTYIVRSKQDGKEYSLNLDIEKLTKGDLPLIDADGNDFVLDLNNNNEIPEWLPQPPGLELIKIPFFVSESGKSRGIYSAQLSENADSTLEFIRNSIAPLKDGSDDQESEKWTIDHKSTMYSNQERGIMLKNLAKWEVHYETAKYSANILIFAQGHEHDHSVTRNERVIYFSWQEH